MSVFILLLIGVAAVSALLILILGLKLHPFPALLLVATAVAVVAGIKAGDIAGVVEGGIGRTLGHISIIITLGAIVGRMVDLSGGAERLANDLVARFGDRRAGLALAIAAFGLGIPVFFEVAVIMLMPVAYGLARTRGLRLLTLSLPMCAVILTVHAMLPPHPGAVAVAGELHVDLGRMLMFGLPIAAVASVVVFLVAKVVTRGRFTVSPDIQSELDPHLPEPGEASPRDRVAGRPSPSAPAPAQDLRLGRLAPTWRTIVALIALPILLIMAGTVAGLVLDPASPLRSVLVFLGIPYVALLIDVLLCVFVLGLHRGASMTQVSEVIGQTIPAVALIIMITGAGGGFASVLVATGIGPALAQALGATGLPIVVLGFLVTMLLRAAQGPTTVALMTTSGIIAPLVSKAALSPNRLTLVALAMGAGGMALSHVNDAGFWIVTRMTGLSVAAGLRTWTVLTTVAGVSALGVIMLIWPLVG